MAVSFCLGWITGHSYVIYGPLANGATTVLFESVPHYPDPGRYWETVQRLGINQLYTAPTALRMLLKVLHVHKLFLIKIKGRYRLRPLGRAVGLTHSTTGITKPGSEQGFHIKKKLKLELQSGDDYVRKYDRSSLKRLGAVGEPLNQEAFHWYHDVVGEVRV